MKEDEIRAIVDRYLVAYNSFDIDRMMEVIHPDIEFKNVSGGEVNAAASSAEEFRQLAERSKALFLSRTQTITKFQSQNDEAEVEIEYEAVLAVDLPNGMKAGETLRLKGRSEFSFRDGKISRLADLS